MSKSIETTSKTSVGGVVPFPGSEPEKKYGLFSWREFVFDQNPSAPDRPEDLKSFYDSFWPLTETYSSQLNPVFLVDLEKVAKQKPGKTWLVRDGGLPLICFFTKNPLPGGFRDTLLIQRDFEELVPDAWRPQVKLYRFTSPTESRGDGRTMSADDGRVDEIYLIGLLGSAVVSLPLIERELKSLVAYVGGPEQLGKIKIKAFLPTRYEAPDLLQPPALQNRAIALLCRYLGTSIEFLEYESFKWMYPQGRSLALEFNSKEILADSYLTILALSKGCHLTTFSDPMFEPPQDEKVLPMYPHVSCAVSPTFQKPFLNYIDENWMTDSSEKIRSFMALTSGPIAKGFPWSDWFKNWCADFKAE